MQIYWVMYYQQPKIYLLSSAIQPVIFDMAVNHGPKQAIKILQHVLNLSGLVNISQDGQLGPITARACDQVYQQMGDYLINALCDERVAFYHRIVARQPNQQIFLNGWLRRAQTYYLA
jgi:lysozyme family protein